MTEDEWIEKHKDEIWVPKHCSVLPEEMLLHNYKFFLVRQPIRVPPTYADGYFDCFDEKSKSINTCRAIDRLELERCYKPISVYGKEENKILLCYNVQEMFIPDSSFVHNRFSLCIVMIAEDRNISPIAFHDWSNDMLPSYLNTMEFSSYSVMDYKNVWISYHCAMLWSEDKFKYVFEKRNNGIYISPVFGVQIEGKDRDSNFKSMVEWKRNYFEEANKKKAGLQ